MRSQKKVIFPTFLKLLRKGKKIIRDFFYWKASLISRPCRAASPSWPPWWRLPRRWRCRGCRCCPSSACRPQGESEGSRPSWSPREVWGGLCSSRRILRQRVTLTTWKQSGHFHTRFSIDSEWWVVVDTHGLRHCGTLIVVFVSASMLGSATGEINGFIGAKGVNGYIRLTSQLANFVLDWNSPHCCSL